MQNSQFQFINPYLTYLNFCPNPDYQIGQGTLEMQNAFHVQINKSQSDSRANVELTLEINMDNDKAPFKLKIAMASDFKWHDLDEKTRDAMLSKNAPALLLAYMRPIVASITNASIFPVYNLPYIDFTKEN